MTKEMLTEYEMTQLSITEQFEELSIAVKYADKLHGAIRRKMYAEGFEEGRKAGREEAEEKSDRDAVVNIDGKKVGEAISRVLERTRPGELTAQERRDGVVEQAKADIEDLKDAKRNAYIIKRGADNDIYRGWCKGTVLATCDVDFIINKDKRTVVALMRGRSTQILYAKGIAKCAPGDCFNVHIGNAIALRRALGLGVPDEYINTPQPTEVCEGDIIRWKQGVRSYRVDKCREDGRYNFTNMRSGERFYGMDYTNIETVVDVIDDSRGEDV